MKKAIAAVAAVGAVLVAGVAAAVPAQAAPASKVSKTTPIYSFFWGEKGCIDGGTPVVFKKRQSVQYLNTNTFFDGPASGRLAKRTVTPGEEACQLPWSLGPTGVTMMDGVVTGVTTPGYPTVQDIKDLGLTTSTPVAEGVWLPKPDAPAGDAAHPTQIRPVRAWVDQDLLAKGADIQNAEMIEWEITGGQGVMVEHWWDSDGETYAVTELNPNGSVRVVQNNFVCYHGTSRGTADFIGGVQYDYGQGALPKSMQKSWPSDGPAWHEGVTAKVQAEFGPTWQGMPFLNPAS